MEELIARLKKDFTTPTEIFYKGRGKKLHLYCLFDNNGVEIFDNFSPKVPADLIRFWRISESAQLFKDVYEGGGLQILSPKLCVIESQGRAEPNELVIGLFLGELDFLIMNCDAGSKGFGEITIGNDRRDRSKWPKVAATFFDFLSMYSTTYGEKFWDNEELLDIPLRGF